MLDTVRAMLGLVLDPRSDLKRRHIPTHRDLAAWIHLIHPTSFIFSALVYTMLRAWRVFFTLHYLIPCAGAGLWEMEPSKFSLKLCSKSAEIMSNVLGHISFYRFVRTLQSIFAISLKFFSQNAFKSSCFPCLLPQFPSLATFPLTFLLVVSTQACVQKDLVVIKIIFLCCCVRMDETHQSFPLSQSRYLPSPFILN